MNFAMVTGIDVTPNLYYYVAKIRIISQTSIIRQHLFGLLLLAIDKNSNKNFLSAKKETFCDISRNEMNHQFYRIVYQYPFWCKLSDTVFEANYVFEGILLPISYIICIWINSYRFGIASIRPTSGIVECP